MSGQPESINTLVRARFGLAPGNGDPLPGNDTIARLLARRSVRRFDARPVAEDLLEACFAAALSAPSKSDLQQTSVIRIGEPDLQREIAALSPDTAWAADAPVLMVWCGDSRRIRRVSQSRGHPFANDHLDAFMNAAVDAGIAMQTFMVAAESMGLGCCPVSQIRDDVEQLSSLLALPQWVFPVAGLCVGWPGEHPPLSMRLPPAVTCHRNRYDDADLLDQVAAYDCRRESAEPTPAAKQRLAERYGISDDYGWSENRARQYSLPAREQFGRYIRDQGFNLS